MKKFLSITGIIIFIVGMLIMLSISPQPNPYLLLEICNGEVTNHWILYRTGMPSPDKDYVDFLDCSGNVVVMKRPSLIVKINQPFEEFLSTYKRKYGISETQSSTN